MLFNKSSQKTAIAVILLSSLTIFSQKIAEQQGQYSAEDFERNLHVENKVYYYWQIQSLKKAVSPRYIRLVDIENYTQNSDLMKKGVLFTFNGLRNATVEVCGNFISWKCRQMKRNRYGIYYTMIKPDSIGDLGRFEMEYKFKVDGFYEFDPVNPDKTEDYAGSYISRFVLEHMDPDKFSRATVMDHSWGEENTLRTIEFKAYFPGASTVAVAGNFNHWDNEMDFLKKQQTGIFRLHKKLKPGDYYYYYIVDGEIRLDTYNPETRLMVETSEIASYLKVEDRNSRVK